MDTTTFSRKSASVVVLDQLGNFPALPLGHREPDNWLAAKLLGI